MKVQAYIYHKRAEKYSDCQDYFGINFQNNLIAVADGMTQSIYPQWWAKILVNAYLGKGHIPALPEELQHCQREWQEKIISEIAKREASGSNPWRLKNAIAEKSGAGATLCGFAWDANGWKFECIGDSSLIVIRNDYAIEVISSQEGDFGNQPDYLDSFREGRGAVKTFNGDFDGIIALLLVTDPFAELFQKHIGDKEFIKENLEKILSLSDHESYREMVECWRDTLDMHNDDSTLIVLNDFSTDVLFPEHVDSLEVLGVEEVKSKEDEISEIPIEKEDGKPQDTLFNEMPVTDSFNGGTLSFESKEFKFEEEKTEAARDFLKAGKEVLKHYKEKRSKGKIWGFLKTILTPLINEFSKK